MRGNRYWAIVVEAPSRLRQCNPCSRAIEELNANIFFKRLDLETHRRLCQIQFLGSLAKAALLGNGPKYDQAEIIKTRHNLI
jgi:hypothetical protein